MNPASFKVAPILRDQWHGHSEIATLIPNHKLYAEVFVGGGAIFWSKPKSEIEVINDTNNELINFY